MTENEPGLTFTARAWREIAGWRDAVRTMPFIRALAEGSLPEEAFAFYLAQDAAYLVEFARALSMISADAPGLGAQVFFAGSAHSALQVESALHRDWLGGRGLAAESTAMSPVTTAYTDHLLASCVRGPYPVAVAAVLPCYWLYAHIGEVLLTQAGDLAGHPYERWIATYADEAFQEATRQARALADVAADTADARTRARMLVAFERSAMHEYLFFDQAMSRPAWPEPPAP